MDQDLIKNFGQLTNGLFSESTFKGLLTGFARSLKQAVGCDRFGVVTIAGPALKRISLKLDGIESLSAEAIEEFVKVSESKRARSDEFLNGWATITLAGAAYCFCGIPTVGREDERCYVIWSPVNDAAATAQTVDFLVMQLQREAHWYRKLENTQTLLYKDDLTGLYNYRYFEVAIDNELARSGRFATQFCLLFIDLDHLKPINDNYGHLSGSSVIRTVADIIRDAVREIDIPIRFGGDEFVVILLGATASKGLLVAERIRKKIAQKKFKMEDGTISQVTASIGVAAYPEHGRSRAQLLKMADESMYRSKRAGKNRVTLVSDQTSLPPSVDYE